MSPLQGALVTVAVLAAGCKMHDRQDEYAAVVKAATGPCAHSTGKGNALAFCVDGRTLIICGDDNGCMTVRLDAEVTP